MTTTAWVNQEGQILKEETPLGWMLIKEIPGSGLQARSAETVPEMVGASAIPTFGHVENPETLEQARLKLHKFPPLSDDAQGGRQRLTGDEVIIQVESLPPPTSEDLSESDRERWLASDAFIQSDDPEIRELTGRLVSDLPPLEAARQLSNWVFENIRKTPTLSIPSAGEVLEQRVGDCNEHTVLFTALARAAGIPTRFCTGLAWSSGQFYYHAWPEVWVGTWVAIDPTFGQFPADPLHLRLLIGGLEKQYEILSLMGRGATIEILETR
jgi:transglutaminase-like putative cysteine protease